MSRLLVLGGLTPTTERLLRAAHERGKAAEWLPPAEAFRTARLDDTVLGMVDVPVTLDAINPSLNVLRWLEAASVTVLNRADALATTHDKLAMARSLTYARIRHPRAVEVISTQMPLPFKPPFVVKPRFGRHGRDAFLCSNEDEFRTTLDGLSERSWFALGGALAQELVSHGSSESIRVVVCGGLVVGANEHAATASDEQTYETVHGLRRFAVPSVHACTAARAAARAVGADLVAIDLEAIGNSYTVTELDCSVDLTDHFGTDIFDLTLSALDSAAESQRAREPGQVNGGASSQRLRYGRER